MLCVSRLRTYPCYLFLYRLFLPLRTHTIAMGCDSRSLCTLCGFVHVPFFLSHIVLHSTRFLIEVTRDIDTFWRYSNGVLCCFAAQPSQTAGCYIFLYSLLPIHHNNVRVSNQETVLRVGVPRILLFICWALSWLIHISFGVKHLQIDRSIYCKNDKSTKRTIWTEWARDAVNTLRIIQFELTVAFKFCVFLI